MELNPLWALVISSSVNKPLSQGDRHHLIPNLLNLGWKRKRKQEPASDWALRYVSPEIFPAPLQLSMPAKSKSLYNVFELLKIQGSSFWLAILTQNMGGGLILFNTLWLFYEKKVISHGLFNAVHFLLPSNHLMSFHCAPSHVWDARILTVGKALGWPLWAGHTGLPRWPQGSWLEAAGVDISLLILSKERLKSAAGRDESSRGLGWSCQSLAALHCKRPVPGSEHLHQTNSKIRIMWHLNPDI